MPLRIGQSRVRRQRYKPREKGLVARLKSVERGCVRGLKVPSSLRV
jgi:hypothetical protein